MAPNSVAASHAFSLSASTVSLSAAPFRPARPAARRSYWSWRCSRYRGDGIYPHTYSYGRLFRYRRSCDPAVDDSRPPIPPFRQCNSWTHKRERHSGQATTGEAARNAAKGRPAPDADRGTRPPDQPDRDLKSNSRIFLAEHDPATWRVRVEKLLREQPYLGIFGETRGVWNPWIRKEWRTIWDEIEADMREVRADLGMQEQGKNATTAKRKGEHGQEASKSEPMQEAAQAREGYNFDPIAMRYVKETEATSSAVEARTRPPSGRRTESSKTAPAVSTPAKMTDLGEEEVEALRSTHPSEKPSPVGFARQPWLSQEWERILRSTNVGTAKNTASVTKGQTLESSLNRMAMRTSKPAFDIGGTPGEHRQQQATPKTQIPGSIPAMTPRASSTATAPRHQSVSVSETRQLLDKNFDATQARFDKQLSSVRKSNVAVIPPTSGSSGPSNFANTATMKVRQTLAETFKAVLEAKKALQQAKDDALKWNLDEEVRTQRSAMESFENKPREPTSREESPVAETKASRFSDAPDISMQRERKARDKALVQEIRQIYEDTYGTIDSRHRQPAADTKEAQEETSDTLPQAVNVETDSSDASAGAEAAAATTAAAQTGQTPQTSPSAGSELPTQQQAPLVHSIEEPRSHSTAPRKPEIYKILAYNKDRDDVLIARTASSIYMDSAPTRSPSQILTHLDQPAKYFDLMETLEATGYELVAGSRRMLVYRRVRPEVAEVPQEGTPFTVEARVRAAEPSRKLVNSRSAGSGAVPAMAVEQAMSSDVVALELAKLRRSETGKMHSLHEQLRRLERQQRGMEKAADSVATRLKSLEAELRKLPRRGRGEHHHPQARASSRLGRLARFLLRIPVLVFIGAAALTSTFVVMVLAKYAYNALWFWWAGVPRPPTWSRGRRYE